MTTLADSVSYYDNQKYHISLGSGDSSLVIGQIPIGHEALQRFQWGIGWVEVEGGWGCPLTETSGHRCVPTSHDSARLTPPPRDSAFLGTRAHPGVIIKKCVCLFLPGEYLVFAHPGVVIIKCVCLFLPGETSNWRQTYLWSPSFLLPLYST